jgi:hypothetical protein
MIERDRTAWDHAEGSIPSRALPFEEHTLAWLRRSERLSPGAAAALHPLGSGQACRCSRARVRTSLAGCTSRVAFTTQRSEIADTQLTSIF